MKTLTAAQAKKLRENICDYWGCMEGEGGWSHPPLEAIASGAHEVIDRATHRAVTVETLTAALHVLRHMQGYYEHENCQCNDPAYVAAALAEIEETLRDA